MSGMESKSLIEANIKESADEMADRLCKEVGYEGKALVSHLLQVLANSLSQQNGELHDVDGGGVISASKLIPYLRNESMWSGLVSAEITSSRFEALASPKRKDSLLSLLLSELGNSDEVAMSSPIFDVVNVKALRGRIGFDQPVAVVDNQAEVYHRFSGELVDSSREIALKVGGPKIIIVNGNENEGNHLSITIEVPDRFGEYTKIFDLLFARDYFAEIDQARKRQKEIRNVPIQLFDTKMDLVLECARIAIEKGCYPHGAVFRGFDGSMVVGRNDTKKDLKIDKHAEALVIDRVGSARRGVLECMMGPCYGCTQRVMASGIVSVNYMLMQPSPWRTDNMPLAMGKNALGEKVNFSWQPQHIPEALDILAKANGSGGVFEGDFRQTVSLNHEWYEDWMQRRRDEEARLSREAGKQVFLHPRALINQELVGLL